MEDPTTDMVLRKTFDHLDQILIEKRRQIKKTVDGSRPVFPSSKHIEFDVREEGGGTDTTVDQS